MVKNTGTADGADAIRPLNQPIPVTVKTGAKGFPVAVKLRRRWAKVDAVEGRWRIDDEWWRTESVSWMYYECVVAQGQSLTLFQDLVTCEWYEQRV